MKIEILKTKQVVRRSIFLLSLFALCFLSCSDACEDVICENEGICNDGTCECPDGYEGMTCEIEKMPTSVTITKVEITRFPETNSFLNNAPWDPNSPPDLYLSIRSQFGDDENESEVLMDYSGGIPLTFNWNTTMNEMDQNYLIILKDQDENGEWQGLDSAVFYPFMSGLGFPEVIEILQPNWYVDFKIYFQYNF